MRRRLVLFAACLLPAAPDAAAQEPATCRVLCPPEFKVEPTITFSNVFAAPKIVGDGGLVERDPVEAGFELILSVGLPTEIPWLGFTVETIFLPFERDGTPELEIESNFTCLASERTGGWLSSHFDAVDKFSAAERPGDRRVYTHKLNFELDTSVAVFNWLAAGRWPRGQRGPSPSPESGCSPGRSRAGSSSMPSLASFVNKQSPANFIEPERHLVRNTTSFRRPTEREEGFMLPGSTS